MHLGRGVERAEGARDHRLAVDPAWSRNAMTPRHRAVLARRDHERVHAAVAVVGGDLLGEPRVEREARAGEGAERGVVAPVEGDEAARLPRGRAGYPRA